MSISNVKSSGGDRKEEEQTDTERYEEGRERERREKGGGLFPRGRGRRDENGMMEYSALIRKIR